MRQQGASDYQYVVVCKTVDHMDVLAQENLSWLM